MTEPILDELISAITYNVSVALVTVVKATGNYGEMLGRRSLVWLDRPPQGAISFTAVKVEALDDVRQCLAQHRPQMLKYGDGQDQISLFVEVQRRPPTLIVVGAGHVALPLVQMGKMIGFEVVVLDDRPKYANRRRFPMADQVLAQPFQETLRNWPIDKDTYIVLVTRGHSHDVECLLEVIDSPARYIGLIGSKRRIRAVFQLLETEMQVDPAFLDRVYGPIGLDIGAETPAEISVGIMAEIINIYRGGRAPSLADAVRADRSLPLHPARINKS
ncbi:MAG: XdhC/CoxI family protein [Anaerolineae bacterium]|nr:XdhC/CoxI family protein [Anaerolineae bacterium]